MINKTDLVDTAALAKLRRILHALNPRAKLIDAPQGAVAASELVNANRFDFDATSSAPGWLVTRIDIGGSLSQAGGALRHNPAGMWWAAQEHSEWPTGDAELEAEIAADWFGDADDMTIRDRRQEPAIIGTGLDEPHWRAAFDACLVTDKEWSQASKGLLADPFPSWKMDEDEHDHDHDHHNHGDDCDCGAHGHWH